MDKNDIVINIPLTLKEIDILMEWYCKGYSDLSKDGPLYEKLKDIMKENVESIFTDQSR